MEAFVKLHVNIGSYFVVPYRFDSKCTNSTLLFNSDFCFIAFCVLLRFIAFYWKYYTHLPNNKAPSENFLTCLVGLTEGEGYFIVKNSKDLAFVNTQVIMDKQVLEYKQEISGFDKVIAQ